MGIHDEFFLEMSDRNPNLLVPWWLMSVWAYENADPILSDAVFDVLVTRLGSQWDSVEHTHKHLLDRDAIKGRMGLKGECPNIIIGSAMMLQNYGTGMLTGGTTKPVT